ncbi:uncharacterized protein UV8b_02841 [Ustilaginoidea virens]|uniref:SNF2 family helicase/ATPase n=1 Tax=Ustilaginoidea virens TaxID=1159556 RepID=A0A8E5HNP9_USTVR|nr:uncharacterized protein UV8b_02841 [Ustilaginoidea virens]QUC18600.1 hypothetical protein UV8b_02841 [Ustilaginoidea virens]
MDGIRSTDPFFWDVDVVAAELCSLQRPCTRDPERLSAKLQENEIDGHTLLTYELVGMANSHDLRNELFQVLNIQLARHKNALGEAIMKLRARSPAFRRWKLENLAAGPMDDVDVHSRGRESTYSARMTPQSEPLHVSRNVVDMNEVNSCLPSTTPQGQDANRAPASPLPSSGQLSMDVEKPNETRNVPQSSMADRHATKIDGDSATAPIGSKSSTNGLKRKRVAPVLIQDKPVNTIHMPIATEADALSYAPFVAKPERQGSTFPWDNNAFFKYLGAGALRVKDVQSPVTSLTCQIRGIGDAISTPVPTRFPPGRRLVVNKIMRRVMNRTSQTINAIDQGFHPVNSRESSGESDTILELDDLAEELDEETMREIEADEAESSKRIGGQSAKFITSSQVQKLLDEEVSDMAQSWRTRKLPKYQNRAFSLWTDASKRGLKRKRILDARTSAKWYGERIKKLETEILHQIWERERDVRLQARCLEQSIEDRLYQSWLADLLESSSDEENFVVVDDEPPPRPAQVKTPRLIPTPLNLERTPTSFLRAGSPVFIDLTQTGSSGNCSPVERGLEIEDRGGVPEDVPTPAKIPSNQAGPRKEDERKDTPQLQPPALLESSSWPNKYQDIEKIVSNPPAYWSRQKDRFALVISLLWRLGHLRRSAVIKHIKLLSADEAFESSILRHITNPIKDLTLLSEANEETPAFDLSRLFLCFLKVKNLKESRLADLKQNQVRKLRAQQGKNSWTVFYTFISRIAPLFPQDNQIYRDGGLDEDLVDADQVEDDELLDEREASDKAPRKSAVKEIVCNKEAVDLRERERRRAEDQEARRLRLRAKLGAAEMMPSDISRLIINETKQDDQPLIYINQEIGSRIKDHQLEGVRFMWNQLIQEPSVRQGCLLSHSMGLGKTMQVITLLVTIREASESPDQGIMSQIPQDLRRSKTLVLCPSSLVNNWTDELLIWDKDQVLGKLHVIDATLPDDERTRIIENWAQVGGIMVLGYSMLRQLYESKKVQQKGFFDQPNIVVADEAHSLKNPASKLHTLCARFHTKSRIAMTGSPLANNIEEYYFMINWVAPNFLGPLSEFREIYAKPIQQGVSNDSLAHQKRRALKMLQVLKQTVAPKVHRATIKTCMDKDLPPKQEFVLCIKPTSLQRELYNLYIRSKRGDTVGYSEDDASGPGLIFEIMTDLSLLCSHPSEFQAKATEAGDASARQERRPSIPLGIIPKVMALFPSDPKHPSLSTKVEILIRILDNARLKGDKVLVFTQSIPNLNFLASLFTEQKRSFSRLDGSTPISKRQDQIKKFNSTETELYLISTKAGGVGLNIQGANRVVIYDFGWNPVNEQQAIGRAYRIGQTKPVTVYHLVTAGTFEQDLHNRAVFKQQLASRVVDKKNPISWGNRLADLKHDIRSVAQEDLTQHLGKDYILDDIISYGGGSRKLCQIIPTDTFEEEDDKAPLSVEEQKEAEDMIRWNLLRAADPAEYRKQKELAERRLQPPSHPAHDSTHSLNAPGLVVTVRVPRSMDGAFDSSTLPTTQTQPGPPQASLSPAAADSTSSGLNLRSDASIPRWSSTPSSAALLPTLGAFTFFGKDERKPAEVLRSDGKTDLTPVTDTMGLPRKANPFSSGNKNQGKTEFREKLRNKLSSMPRARFPSLSEAPAEKVADQIVDSIDVTLKILQRGFLPDIQHWRALCGFAEHDRFITAVLSGVLTASYLARTDVKELERKMAVLNDVSQAEFEAKTNNKVKEMNGGPRCY